MSIFVFPNVYFRCYASLYEEAVGFFSEMWYKCFFQRDIKCQKYVKSVEKALSLGRALAIPIKLQKGSGNQTCSELKPKHSQV
jgi:hypothetical protein